MTHEGIQTTNTPEKNAVELQQPDEMLATLSARELQQFSEIIAGFNAVNPDKASKMLQNSPEKAKKLNAGLKKFWAIANVFSDIVVGGVALGIMIKNLNPQEEMDFTPTNIAALTIAVASITKLTWDLVGMGEKDKKTA